MISGASTFRIFTRHILPSHLNDIFVIATFNCSLIISLEANTGIGVGGMEIIFIDIKPIFLLV